MPPLWNLAIGASQLSIQPEVEMDTTRFIVRDTDIVNVDIDAISLIGGKALGLHQLKSQGIDVPRWATISTRFLQQVSEGKRDLEELLASEDSAFLAKAGRIRDYLSTLSISEEARNILSTVWDDISESGQKAVAVRSSAADEDSADLSFAGQMESFLNVNDFKQFMAAVRGCWASMFAERAVFYRQQNKLPCWSLQIAVIVQQMIQPEVAGVIFSANPLNGNTEEMLVSSAWGLGEGLVSGSLAADTYVLDVKGFCIRKEIAEKRYLVASNLVGGTEKIKATEDLCNRSTLDEGDLHSLHDLALKVQNFTNRPMDIEFALSGGCIYLLQARPITTMKASLPPEPDNFKIWDNSNIVESYAGVTTPLTFSFIRKAYFAVYCQFCEMMGVDSTTIARNRHVFENMLGLIQGRVYYNLLNWYRLISLMPGYKYNKSFMEQMLGLRIAAEYVPETVTENILEKYLLHYPKLFWIGCRMVFNHLTLDRKVTAFHQHFSDIYLRYSKIDFAQMSSSRLHEIYRHLEAEVLWHWKAPILNDFEAMVFYGLLRRFTREWGLDTTGSLHNDLLCGEGGIRSTEVTSELFRIAAKIDRDPSLKEAFLQYPADKTLRLLRDNPAFRELEYLLQAYLEQYGVRSINEMKLESVPVKDEPTFCISVIQNYLRNGVPDPKQQLERERSIRMKAEENVRNGLRGKKLFGIIPKLTLFMWFLRNTRKAVRNRENQRFARSEAYDLARRIMRALGAMWHRDNILEKREDIFYLEIDEIWAYLEGTSTCTDLKTLAKLRKQEFSRYQAMSPADRFETSGEVYRRTSFGEKGEQNVNTDQLHGLGCCQGIVEESVRIVVSPGVDIKLNGEIMVAKQTDPGWIMLFPSISGLIVEKGSLLSHSAIVAREMGIPTVVGVKDATTMLHDGDRIRMDGTEGQITILQRFGT